MKIFKVVSWVFVVLMAGLANSAPATPGGQIVEARARANQGNFDGALELLQEVYRQAPSPDVATMIVQIYPRTKGALASMAAAKIALWTAAVRTDISQCTAGRMADLEGPALRAVLQAIERTESKLEEANRKLAERTKEVEVRVAALQREKDALSAHLGSLNDANALLRQEAERLTTERRQVIQELGRRNIRVEGLIP